MLETELVPDQLPFGVKDGKDVSVVHCYPDEWDDTEMDLHRYDACPCGGVMSQVLGEGRSYRWQVVHVRSLT